MNYISASGRYCGKLFWERHVSCEKQRLIEKYQRFCVAWGSEAEKMFGAFDRALCGVTCFIVILTCKVN